MGKAIRNFKDAISGVEEASFRKLDEKANDKAQDPSNSSTAASTDEARAKETETNHKG